MTERSYFEKKAKLAALNPTSTPIPAGPGPGQKPEPPKPSAWAEWLKKLQEAADKDVSIRRDNKDGDGGSRKKNGKK